MRWIYISPHFDDAVLSCGGLIWEQSRQDLQVEIWTIFGGEPPEGPLSNLALAIHFIWKSGDGVETIAMRKQEDEEAAACVGADIVHFDFQDCIYRRSPRGETLYPESVFTSAHPGDSRLPGKIATALKSELLAEDVLVVPLALGGHIDHVLARQGVERLGRPLRYYADIPYLLNDTATLAPAIAAMSPVFHPVSHLGIDAWWQGIAAYRSQIDSLYRGEGTLEQAIRRHAAENGGIQLWQAAPERMA